ncbi:hypothetical protein CEE69_12865 [Rhodopirellula bahusiensis]|uniref:Uncharacterized protein n=1 Tax=Rhodopirellula bahusiensis TaxID=2014065 RepID=A0A2G1W6U3_9BACT|nr:hypothetical protein CEE69_12865 [Rhodopirellula bahusiensis]
MLKTVRRDVVGDLPQVQRKSRVAIAHNSAFEVEAGSWHLHLRKRRVLRGLGSRLVSYWPPVWPLSDFWPREFLPCFGKLSEDPHFKFPAFQLFNCDHSFSFGRGSTAARTNNDSVMEGICRPPKRNCAIG